MTEHDGHSHDHPAIEDRVRALESLLVEKGITTVEDIDRLVALAESNLGPLLGRRVAARAWLDPAFKQRLLTDAPSACSELGIEASNLVVIESTRAVHHVVCCTLCSCYPSKVLGLPPTWYKSPAYRSRVVIEPRAVLAEFGCRIDEQTEIRVWDSSSEVRYMVLPERPAGTEGMSEDELVELITRDSLVGVQRLDVPAAV